MDINWSAPFDLAGKFALLVLGWGLITLIALFSFALLLGFIGAFKTVLAKSKENNLLEAKKISKFSK